MKLKSRILVAIALASGLAIAAAWAMGVVLDRPGPLAYHPLVASGIGLVFWVMGLIVLVGAKPFHIAASLVGLNTLAGLAVIFAPASNLEIPLARHLAFNWFVLLPIPFVYFFANFPAVASGELVPPSSLRWAIRFVITASLGLFAVRYAMLLLGLNERLLQRPLFANLGIGLAVGIWLALRRYRAATIPHHRDQLKVIAVGLVVGVLPFALLSALPQAWIRRPLLPPELTVIGTVFLPLSLGYAILRRELLNVDLVISRGLVYGTMSAALLAAYFIILNIVQLTVPVLIWREHVPLILGLTVVSATLYGPLRGRLERVIDRWVYGDDYDYGEAMAWFGEEFSRIEPVDLLAQRFLDRLGGMLNLTAAAIVLEVQDPSFESVPPQPLLRRPSANRTIATWRDSLSEGLTVPELDMSELSPSHLPRLAQGFAVRLHSNGHQLGLLRLGPKVPACNFSSRDISLITSLAPQLAIALDNALLVEQLEDALWHLERLQSELARVEDEGRQALARDLHDSLLQRLIYARRLAERELMDASKQAAATSDTLEAIQGAIGEVRSVCAGLQPPGLEEQGLAAVLAALVETAQLQCDTRMHFALVTPGAGEALPPPVRLSLLRAAQEMLHNVVKHADATEAYLYLEEADSILTVSVWDNGKGFEIPGNLADLVRSGHLGLANLEQRARQLGGRLELHSKKGYETQVSICIPLGGESKWT